MTAHLEFDRSDSKVAQRIHMMRSSPVRDLFSAATRDDVISLSGGMPDVRLLPADEVDRAVAAALADVNDRSVALQYGSTDGRPGMRAVVCDIVRDIGIRCKPENVILTSGAQEALDLIGKTFIDPGDIILAEGPTYLGALQAFSAYQPDVHCIECDDDGMRMDLLEAELERIGHDNPRLKFAYVIPNFQNPSGVTMSAERRRRLVELSHEYGFLIVEDDPYGRIRFEGGHQIPLKALDDQVIYLGTISKVFAPGLRVGWIVAPRHVLSKINLVKQGADLCGSSLDQAVVQHYFTDTPWQRTLQRFISVYTERRDAMLAALEEHFPAEARWTHPEGGLFVWVTLPEYVDTGSMLAEALDAGVTYVPGDSFYPGASGGKNCMRINFSYESPENITEAIRRLAEVIEARLELYRVFIEAGAIDPARAPINTH
ncbi:PLP-dependent aminotransferase family protein [Adlercreutzia murintestinalis]|uniref:aminotransferase-like domain-containing protein n=1 Tax=Adlercreutzia murintestinalis TaxID=2941325 RepID=UPI002040071E|nr:PLP-dependent aminotransferase family protein [Adlercreutzia murintestinalis]